MQQRPLVAAVITMAIAGAFHACAASGDPPGVRRGSSGSGGSSTGGTGGSTSGTGAGGMAGSFVNAGGTTGSGTGGTSTMTTGGTTPTGGGMAPADAGFMDMCNPSTLMPAGLETCGNGLDENLNGFIDEFDEATKKACPCTAGQTQPCFGGRPWDATRPNCVKGTQKCEGTEFPGWGKCTGWMCDNVPPPGEECWNSVDDDCDGTVDEGCVLDVPVMIPEDCVSVSCPPQAPYPVGCDLMMSGNDSRGCVANAPGSSSVYFREGDLCPLLPGLGGLGAGDVKGTLFCGVEMRDPLDAMNCAINKADPIYVADKSGCPGG